MATWLSGSTGKIAKTWGISSQISKLNGTFAARARSAAMTVSSSSISVLPTIPSIGGRPSKSAKTGETKRSSVIASPMYRSLMLDVRAADSAGSLYLLNLRDLPLWLKSAIGDRIMAFFGRGVPSSRKASKVLNTRPPPAESPAMVISSAAIPCASRSWYAARQSSRPPGKGISGARR